MFTLFAVGFETEIMLLTRGIKRKGPIGKREDRNGGSERLLVHMLLLAKGVEDHANRKACHSSVNTEIGKSLGTWFGEICSCKLRKDRNKFHQTTYQDLSRSLYRTYVHLML